MRKFVKCKAYCIYNENGYCQKKQPNMSYHGYCEDKKKNVSAYVQDFYAALGESNMLDPALATEDVRIGAYYTMRIFNLAMVQFRHGDWGWFGFVGTEDETKTPLKVDDIIKRDINENVLIDLINKCKEGKLPPFEDELDAIEEAKKVDEKRQEALERYKTMEPYGYGFLSPAGAFYKVPWGDHEKFALDFMKKMGLKIFRELQNTGNKTATDYMIYNCNYVLIHNPSKVGSPIVSRKPGGRLTNSQKNFLYDYFMILDDRMMAEHFLEEE